MVDSIYTYALIKALYDEGEDYVDSFWPILVKTLPSNQSVTSSFLQKKVRDSSNLEVPLHVLELILARAEKRGFLRHWRDRSTNTIKYRLTSAGIKYSADLETDKEVERRINALLENMRQFFEGKGFSLSFDEMSDLLNHFIHKNIDLLTECINPSLSLTKPTPPKIVGFDRHLFEFIKSAEYQKPDDFRTLENMVCGSIISVLLYVDEPAEIIKIRTQEFNRCQCFLDTNFVFSVLGLHTEEFNEPAKELFNILKKHKFEIKVFGFTVAEISRVINSYYKESYRYPTSVRVNTLYSSLKTKGWTKTDAREFIINIEQILQKKGITIEWMKEINLDKYSPDEGLRNVIKAYKPDQNSFHRNHDLVAIAKIKEIRQKPIRRIEDSRAIFVTSDQRLHRFDLIEEGHKQNATICETVLDRLMTNILWLKDPNSKLSLKTIIAAHSRGLFVNRRVWDRFYEVLQELKKEGKIKDNDIATLFWHSYLEDTLISIEETETNKITPEFVLEEIETAGKLREKAIKKEIKGIEKTKDKEMAKELRKKETEFAEALKKSISDVESRKEEEWLAKIERIKENLRKKSEDKANRWSTFWTLLLIFAYIIAVTMAYYSIPYNILDLAISVVGFGGILGLLKFRNKIRGRLSKRFYRKKLEEVELDKIP